MNLKSESIKRTFMIIISIVITLMLFIFSIGAFFVIPDFIILLKNLDSEVPVLTNIIIYSYKYWLLLPFIALIINIIVWRSNEVIPKRNVYYLGALFGLLFIAITLFVLTVLGMYAPISALEN